MSGNIDAATMLVVNAIRMSLHCDGGPGMSVNHQANPFLMGVIGTLDMLKMAERVLKAQAVEAERLAKVEVEQRDKLEYERLAKVAADRPSESST